MRPTFLVLLAALALVSAGLAAEAPPPLVFTDGEARWIRENPKLRIGVDSAPQRPADGWREFQRPRPRDRALLAVAMHGEVAYEDAPGGGARFVRTVPRTQP